jgi:hypothetical protein
MTSQQNQTKEGHLQAVVILVVGALRAPPSSSSKSKYRPSRKKRGIRIKQMSMKEQGRERSFKVMLKTNSILPFNYAHISRCSWPGKCD